MTDSDKKEIYITIVGQRIPLSVSPGRQGDVRRAEREVADLFDSWHNRFPTKTDMELLAMVAYQFAYAYGELKQRYEAARDLALQLDDRLAAAQNVDLPSPSVETAR